MKLILQSVAILLATVSSLDSSISYTHSIGDEAYYYAFSSYCAESTLNDWPSDFKADYPPSSDLQQFELSDVITADDSKLQCFAGWDPVNSRIVLAFRGSRMNVENWATNLNAQQTDYPNYRGVTNARVHAGFYNGVKDLEGAGLTNAITELITAHPGADVFSTGHSLGGAMASIAALNLKMSETYRNLRIGEVDVVTFGMPRWANSATADAYENYMRSSWRIVNGNDPFVTIPDGGDYQHVARQIQYKGSSSTEHWMCDGSGDDSNCFGNDVVDMLAFTLDIDDHTSYFGYGWTPMCDCDEGYWRDGHGIDACPSSHPDKDAGLCYENCKPGYNMVGPTCWEYCDGNEVGPVCVTQDLESRAKHTYGRGVGTIPDGCDPGWVEQNGLCHKPCKSGYELHGLIGQCKEKCRSGYDDHGLTCFKWDWFNSETYWKDGYGTGSGVGKIKTWCPSGKENIAGLCYTHCKSGYTGVLSVCWEDCKSNEENDGAFCRIPLESHLRDTYLRGIGVPMQCADDEEQILFMCYPKCRDGFMSVGPHCSPDTCVTPTSPPTNAVDDGSVIPDLEKVLAPSHWIVDGNPGYSVPIQSLVPECKPNHMNSHTQDPGKYEHAGTNIGVTCCNDKGVGSRPDCNTGRELTYDEALDVCESKGLRICTMEETAAGVGAGKGCQYDHTMVWTSDSCNYGSVLEPNKWLLVLNQDVSSGDGYFASNIASTGIENKDDPNANTFSIVGGLDKNEFKIDGKYKFRLGYPKLTNGATFDKIWTQTSWLMDAKITGSSLGEYNAAKPNELYGLGLSNQGLLDGNAKHHGHWWFAAGTIKKHGGGIPAMHGVHALRARVYVCTGADCDEDSEIVECSLDENDALSCESSSLPVGCPSDDDFDYNAPCDYDGQCEFGEETCCGVTHASMVCSCGGDRSYCYYTEACMSTNCDVAPTSTNVQVGSTVRLSESEAQFKASFESSGYIWHDSMRVLLGQTVTVVDIPKPGFFGLPECVENSGQPVWWYPLGVIDSVIPKDAERSRLLDVIYH